MPFHLPGLPVLSFLSAAPALPALPVLPCTVTPSVAPTRLPSVFALSALLPRLDQTVSQRSGKAIDKHRDVPLICVLICLPVSPSLSEMDLNIDYSSIIGLLCLSAPLSGKSKRDAAKRGFT